MRNTIRKWGSVSQFIHWLTFFVIVGMLISGFAVSEWIDAISSKFKVIQWHKSFGILILSLTALRLIWRSVSPTPSLPRTMSGLERRLAALSHILLYGLLFAMPLVGWLMISSSTRAIPTVIFGLFTLPRLIGPDAALHEFFENLHLALAILFMIVIFVHIAAALKHHFINKDDVLKRMLPFSNHRGR